MISHDQAALNSGRAAAWSALALGDESLSMKLDEEALRQEENGNQNSRELMMSY